MDKAPPKDFFGNDVEPGQVYFIGGVSCVDTFPVYWMSQILDARSFQTTQRLDRAKSVSGHEILDGSTGILADEGFVPVPYDIALERSFLVASGGSLAEPRAGFVAPIAPTRPQPAMFRRDALAPQPAPPTPDPDSAPTPAPQYPIVETLRIISPRVTDPIHLHVISDKEMSFRFMVAVYDRAWTCCFATGRSDWRGFIEHTTADYFATKLAGPTRELKGYKYRYVVNIAQAIIDSVKGPQDDAEPSWVRSAPVRHEPEPGPKVFMLNERHELPRGTKKRRASRAKTKATDAPPAEAIQVGSLLSGAEEFLGYVIRFGDGAYNLGKGHDASLAEATVYGTPEAVENAMSDLDSARSLACYQRDGMRIACHSNHEGKIQVVDFAMAPGPVDSPPAPQAGFAPAFPESKKKKRSKTLKKPPTVHGAPSLSEGATDILFHALGLQTEHDRKATRDYFATTPDAKDHKLCIELESKGLFSKVPSTALFPGANYRATEDGKSIGERLWKANTTGRYTKRAMKARAKYLYWLDMDNAVSFRDFLSRPEYAEWRQRAIEKYA